MPLHYTKQAFVWSLQAKSRGEEKQRVAEAERHRDTEDGEKGWALQLNESVQHVTWSKTQSGTNTNI